MNFMAQKNVTLQAAEEVASSLLKGAWLDRISAYSLEFNLNFLSENINKKDLTEVSLRSLCEMNYSGSFPLPLSDDIEENCRASFLAKSYLLLGKTVSDVAISENGLLTIFFDDDWVSFLPSDSREEDFHPWILAADVYSGDGVSFAEVGCAFDEGKLFFFTKEAAQAAKDRGTHNY